MRSIQSIADDLNRQFSSQQAWLLAEIIHEIQSEVATKCFIRTEIDGIEINLFARGEREGKPVVVVGKSKMQINERRANYKEEAQLFEQLENQREVTHEQYPNATPISIIVTHYARPSFI